MATYSNILAGKSHGQRRSLVGYSPGVRESDMTERLSLHFTDRKTLSALALKVFFMPFAATWMELEMIILSEVRQRKTNII